MTWVGQGCPPWRIPPGLCTEVGLGLSSLVHSFQSAGHCARARGEGSWEGRWQRQSRGCSVCRRDGPGALSEAGLQQPMGESWRRVPWATEPGVLRVLGAGGSPEAGGASPGSTTGPQACTWGSGRGGGGCLSGRCSSRSRTRAPSLDTVRATGRPRPGTATHTGL